MLKNWQRAISRGRRRRNRPFAYETCCVNSTAELISDMVDRAVQVTWETFRRHVSWREVRYVFPQYSYRREGFSPETGEQTIGFHIKDDWAVSFWRSVYNGRRCYYIEHSGIEYIFTGGR